VVPAELLVTLDKQMQQALQVGRPPLCRMAT